MYEAIITSLDVWQLIVVAVVCHVLGARARQSSKLASSLGIPIGILATCVLVAEGWQASEMQFSEFLSLDFMRIGIVGALLIGVCSVGTKLAEPLVNQVSKSGNRMMDDARRRRQKAEEAREAARSAARWEEGRSAREAHYREQKERERQEERRKQLAAKQKREDDKRREAARQRLLLAYHKHSPKIQASISWERFQEYMSTFMNDSKPVDQVEKSAMRMIETIKSHFQPAVKKVVRKSVVQIFAEFDSRKQVIATASLPEDQRAARIAELEMQLALEMERNS